METLSSAPNPNIRIICTKNQERGPFAQWCLEQLLSDKVSLSSAGLVREDFPSELSHPARFRMKLELVPLNTPVYHWDTTDQVPDHAQIITFTRDQAREVIRRMPGQRVNTYGDLAGDINHEIRSPHARMLPREKTGWYQGNSGRGLEERIAYYERVGIVDREDRRARGEMRILATIDCFNEIMELAPAVIRGLIERGVLKPEHVKDPNLLIAPEIETSSEITKLSGRGFRGLSSLAAFWRR